MDRTAMVQRLAADQFDLLVIGGGITGAGIAREAALRGLRVALVEAADFACGTSSRSTKLIHGGLRYLKNMEFRLVRESVVERQRLLTMAPHIARATEFLFPVYEGDPDSLFMLNLGLTFYDWFAGSGNPIPHRMRRPAEVLGLEPLLRPEGLQGGAVYCDARTDDGRLTLEVIQSAVAYGATVANYMQLTGFRKDRNGRLIGVLATDRLSGESMAVRATKVVAAAGPWADEIRRLDDPGAPSLLRLTKGVHLTFPKERLPLTHAVVIRGRDARMMFAVPSGDYTYVGTTDTDFEGDPAQLTVDAWDVEYILDAARRAFPAAGLTEGDIASTWAGVRPLIRPAEGKNPSATSRDYALFHSQSGLVTVAGGKLTAFRAMASHIIDGLYPATRSDAHLRASAAPLRPAGAPLPAGTDTLARTRHAVQHEMAMRLEDVVARRTELLLFSPDNGTSLLEPIAAEMAVMLDWSEARRQEEIQRARAQIAAMFAWRKEAAAPLQANA